MVAAASAIAAQYPTEEPARMSPMAPPREDEGTLAATSIKAGV
jgi:hypothetical protein